MQKLYTRLGALMAVLAIGFVLNSPALVADVPFEPQNQSVAVTAESNGQGAAEFHVNLSWEANENGDPASGYNIYGRIDDPDADNDFTLLATTGLTEHEFTGTQLDELLPSSLKRYEFTIAAYNNDGESETNTRLFAAFGSNFPPGDTHNNEFGFVSEPPSGALVGQEYSYQPETWPANIPLQYELVEGPDGMTVDPETGEVRWTPQEAGSYTVTIKGHLGGVVPITQTWIITVPVGLVISGVEDPSATARNLQVYPNPVSDVVSLRFDSTPGDAVLSLVNSLGNTVSVSLLQTRAGSNTASVRVQSLPVGAYILNVRHAAGIISVPVQIVR